MKALLTTLITLACFYLSYNYFKTKYNCTSWNLKEYPIKSISFFNRLRLYLLR